MLKGIDFKVWEKPSGPFLHNLVDMATDIKILRCHAEDGYCYYTVSMKVTSFSISQLNLIKKHAVYYGEYEACWEDGCFEPTAGDKSVILFDKHGETVHDVCQACAKHLPPIYLQLLKTLYWIDFTPGEQYWERAAVWKLGKCWYSQKLENCSEGDYESGYWDYIAASEHLGPFKTEDEAIEAAKNYEEF